ncbi:Hypothetical predicted protein [Cloeon dipterum]|uniref:Uncharacterized protein n=1 Tax=Cloeon dipterum TaxID=197152 RepID=A0A8S1CYA0_9INSE|nr:Hypothetical predicted protein [Cloeon dipterum]
MLRSTDFATKIRYPLVFGTILGAFYWGFTNRNSFFGDLEKDKSALMSETAENKSFLESKIAEINETRRNK